MKYKAIIFDMDGTIVDTEHVWHGATTMLMKQFNVALPVEQSNDFLRQAIGLSVIDSCKNLKNIVHLEDSAESLGNHLIMHAKTLYQGGVRFIPGFIEFYKRAQQCGLKMGIATNADDHTLALARSSLNLDSFFGQHIYNPSFTNNKGKPDPAIYLHAAAQLAIDPQECIAIEDSAHGINAARAANMFCIGIGTSPDPEQTREAHFAIAGYEEIDLDELLRL